MNKLIAIAAVVGLMSSGCALRMGPGASKTGSSGSALNSGGSQSCDNNQYWDGTMCRHKGKGHGARKHDG